MRNSIVVLTLTLLKKTVLAIHFLGFVAVFTVSCLSQSPGVDNKTSSPVPNSEGNSSINKDSRAIAIAQSAMAAAGTAAPGGIVLKGQVRMPSVSAESMSIVLEFNGGSQMRSQVATPKGDVLWVVSNGQGAIKRASHAVRYISRSNTLFQHPLQIPLLSHLSEVGNPSVAVEYVGTDQVNGVPVEAISLSVASASSADASFTREITRVLYDIDTTTGYVLRVRGVNVAENDSGARQIVETLLSDYRIVNGVAIPFRQQTFTDGSLLQDLTLNTAEVGVSLPDSDFALPN